MPEAPQPDPQPGPLAPLAARVASRRVGGRLLGAFLLAGVAAVSGWLLAPGDAALRMPGDEALGTPAVGTFKAPRDYDIPDEETTRRRREEAAAAERRVYDHDHAYDHLTITSTITRRERSTATPRYPAMSSSRMPGTR